MAKEHKKSSLRESTLANIGSFLYKEKFRPCDVSIEGILELVNLISDYYEEGTHLYPEVVITNDFAFFKTIPSRHIEIKETNLNVDNFKGAIKDCAPLAINGWIIYIEILPDKIKYGLISAEMRETSLSLYSQMLNGEEEIEGATIAYIRNLGQKIVELVGINNKLIVSLTLDDDKKTLNDEVSKLSKIIAEKCDTDYIDKIETFFDKTINEAIKNGHGNLIGIIDDSEDNIKLLKNELVDGIYLKEPIEIGNLIILAEKERTNETSVALKAYSSLFISMLNHDGITIITNRARIIGYHLFIKEKDEKEGEKQGNSIVGGARRRAFESMKKLGLKVCFYRSQDGNIKYHNHE